MKFNLSDFLQLDTNGLLAVNGGSGCSSGASSGGGTCSNISQKNERLSIQEAVTKHLDEKYIIGVNDCDIWKDFDYYGL